MSADLVELPRGPSAAFRGWQVVAALFVCGFLLYGGGVYAFILFVPPLATEFHWTTASTGSLVSAFWISAPLTLFAGPLIRRFDAKRLVVAGIVVEAVSLMVLPIASTLLQMYLLRTAAGLGKVLFAITLPIILARWFNRRFGLAAAIMYSGWHVGGLCLAPATEYLLSNIGWRTTSIVLGIVQLAVAIPASIWGLRLASAAEAGLDLDGAPVMEGATNETAVNEESEPSARYFELLVRLLALPTFQLIALATPLYYLVYGGVLLQQAAAIQGSGFDSYGASLAVGITAGCAAVGALLGGWAFDRYSQVRDTFVAFSLLGIGVLCLLLATQQCSGQVLWLHAVIFGLGIGCGDIYWITLLKRKMPADLFPSAWGIWYFLQLISLIVAPWVSGSVFDHTQSYPRMLFVELVILSIALGVALLVVKSGPRFSPTA